MNDERTEKAATMRGAGATYKEIGVALGVSKTTAYRLVDPSHREAELAVSRRWKENHREQARSHNYDECACGKRKRIKSERCVECHTAFLEEKAQRIVALWREGLTHRQIAERLGRPWKSVQVTVVQLRKQGYDLPRRPPGRFRHHRTLDLQSTTDLAA